MIPAIGVYQNIPADVYHSWEACSNSQLSILHNHSPKHLISSREIKKNPTDAMILGTAVHAAVLEPSLFASHYRPKPVGDKRTTKWKAAFAELKEECPTVPPDGWLDFDVFRQVVAMSNAVAAHPKAARLLDASADRELSLVWEDKATGIRCKARLDAIAATSKGLILVDIKTTTNARADEFSKTIYDYGYHRQAAFYLQGMAYHQMHTEHVVIVAVEKEPPYEVGAYILGNTPSETRKITALEVGWHEVSALLARYAECERSGHWPGYSQQLEEINLPGWAQSRIEREYAL